MKEGCCAEQPHFHYRDSLYYTQLCLLLVNRLLCGSGIRAQPEKTM